ncbi:MAG: hypothetical protein SFT91_04700 [Rickettsiaceae bacterium]|nr:hypothetical protein [Rickettsiaceae bacterium]
MLSGAMLQASAAPVSSSPQILPPALEDVRESFSNDLLEKIISYEKSIKYNLYIISTFGFSTYIIIAISYAVGSKGSVLSALAQLGSLCVVNIADAYLNSAISYIKNDDNVLKKEISIASSLMIDRYKQGLLNLSNHDQVLVIEYCASKIFYNLFSLNPLNNSEITKENIMKFLVLGNRYGNQEDVKVVTNSGAMSIHDFLASNNNATNYPVLSLDQLYIYRGNERQKASHLLGIPDDKIPLFTEIKCDINTSYTIRNISFDNCNMIGITIENITFENVHFNKVTLFGARLKKILFVRCEFTEIDIRYAHIEDLETQDSEFAIYVEDLSKLEGAVFERKCDIGPIGIKIQNTDEYVRLASLASLGIFKEINGKIMFADRKLLECAAKYNSHLFQVEEKKIHKRLTNLKNEVVGEVNEKIQLAKSEIEQKIQKGNEIVLARVDEKIQVACQNLQKETTELRAELKGEIRDIQINMNQKFKLIDQRFELIDQRFGSIDKRFDGVDQRLGDMDQRLSNMDQRLGDISQKFESMQLQLERIANNQQAFYAHSVNFESYTTTLLGSNHIEQSQGDEIFSFAS